jgi:Holliday junction resolvase RusA-like endonuclease
MILEIIIPGRPISGNHSKVPTEHGSQVRSKESREYDARIASIAKAAVVSAGWKMPDYVRVDMTIVGSRTDRDNACKEILDPCQGIVFAHDSRVLDGFIKRVKDDGGPRVILHISAVNGQDYGYTKPRKPVPIGYYIDDPPIQSRSVPQLRIKPRLSNPRPLGKKPHIPTSDQIEDFAPRWLGDTVPSRSAAEAKRRTARKHAVDTALIPAISFAERDELLRKVNQRR